MNDDPAQSSGSSYDEGTQTQNQSGQLPQAQPQQSVVSPSTDPVTTPSPVQPGANLPHKEQEPTISEHIRVSDASETQPEIQQELREYGVEVKTDEAKLELTREHQELGMSHSPHSTPVQSVVEPENKEAPEFPMTMLTAQEEAKKESVWHSLRWLAVYVLRQMKIKKIAGQTT